MNFLIGVSGKPENIDRNDDASHVSSCLRRLLAGPSARGCAFSSVEFVDESGGALDSSGRTHSGNPIVGFQPVGPLVGSSRPAGALGTTAESQAVSGLAGLRVNGDGSSGGALETIDQSPQTAGSGDGFDEAWRAEARREAEMFIGSDSSSSEPIAINGGGGGMSRTKSIGSRLASTSLVERTGDWRRLQPRGGRAVNTQVE